MNITKILSEVTVTIKGAKNQYVKTYDVSTDTGKQDLETGLEMCRDIGYVIDRDVTVSINVDSTNQSFSSNCVNELSLNNSAYCKYLLTALDRPGSGINLKLIEHGFSTT